jgi:cytochrome b involved in lipid metabolism
MAVKVYTLEECRAHMTEKSCWLVIHGKVYDVTDFLEEHPGGYDVMVSATGKDATHEYDDIGHSSSATKMLAKYLLGEYEGGDVIDAVDTKSTSASAESASSGSKIFYILLPLILIIVALILNQMPK